eukprot:2093402-Prymnesium_polylepis.1
MTVAEWVVDDPRPRRLPASAFTRDTVSATTGRKLFAADLHPEALLDCSQRGQVRGSGRLVRASCLGVVGFPTLLDAERLSNA